MVCGEINAKRHTCPVSLVLSKAGTPQDRVWRHTRGKVFCCNIAAAMGTGDHAHSIIPVGTTVSVHGFRPSPFRVVTQSIYIVAEREGFVKEICLLFTIRLLCGGAYGIHGYFASGGAICRGYREGSGSGEILCRAWDDPLCQRAEMSQKRERPPGGRSNDGGGKEVR